VAEFTLSKGATAKVGNTAQESGVPANISTKTIDVF
jgi:hypothetical protein